MTAVLLAAMWIVPFWGPDPSPSLTRSKEAARRYECEWVSPETAKRQFPGRVREAKPRGEFVERTIVVCTQPVLGPGVRHPRDAAILRHLEATTAELASAAASLRPDLADRTWLVEVFYPNAQVSPKIGFATKAALMDDGLQVSDRAPVLGASDVEVLTRMPPSVAYPAACTRYTDTGSLDSGHALLAVLVRDPRETILHAGVCADGQWMWLR